MSQVRTAWETCRQLFDLNVFDPDQRGNPALQSVIIHQLICLNDLLQKASKDGARVNFSDHVTQTDKIKDVTDLVRECRNAACHIGSTLSDVDFGKFAFVAIRGKGDAIVFNGEPAAGNEFDDDIAIYYGNMRIYVRRHIARALREVKTALRID
ncbi:hypothetical protein F3J16_21725 [Burkholderia sp. Ap-962]|uniref:hypothetical protein n=1 Tax=Burkholderia sp. Ap-962 TaxID=2608333 RepID=UPI001421C794|nr:hypothetical protein [Burkholderia sp. Ap-962]NIF72781.1 hypothetical protein [Burkholderia sp. Ap-962]